MSLKEKSSLKEFFSYFLVIIIAVFLSVLFRIFLFEPYIVPTSSMEPTLNISDRVIVSKLSYKFSDIKRGDLVVFHSLTEPGKDLVKRAVAFEGEEITFDQDGFIYINNNILEESYLPDSTYYYESGTFEIEENHIFVMGDNRNNSYDSRYFGTIEESSVFGKVLFIYWPPKRISIVR